MESSVRTIVVEGLLASGKTTFLDCFASTDAELIYEPLELWRDYGGRNMLDEMYCDPDQATFPFQVLVLQSMAALLATPPTSRLRIVERCMYSVRHCFVEAARDVGDITHAEWLLLRDLEQLLTRLLSHARPHLIVYLRLSPEQALRRCNNRERDEESMFSLDHMRRLYDKYEAWLGIGGYSSVPVLVFDVTDDPLEMSKLYSEAIGKLDWM